MTPLTVLYIDMNSFFASVEQELDPALRGRPVAITAVDATSGSCVAASYEAKAYGVKTGTSVQEARRLCPQIQFRPSRHRLYVKYNLAVADVLDRYAELTAIRSVDEFQIALSGDNQTVEGGYELVRRLKAAVARDVGARLRFSAGLGSSSLVAKIAGKLEKPDGCRWLSPDNMPGAIEHLALDDLPGISAAMKQRLFKAGVYDVRSLYRLDPRHARLIWRSVEGERFVRMLQGTDIPLVPTKRGGYGNSKVLSPEFRHPLSAYRVGRWLIEKSAARLRRDGRVSGRFTLSLSFLSGARWNRSIKCFPSQDTGQFLCIHRDLWRGHWHQLRRSGGLISIGIHLGDVQMLIERKGDLFHPLRSAERTRGEQVSRAVDQINARFGESTIKFGINSPHPGFFERG